MSRQGSPPVGQPRADGPRVQPRGSSAGSSSSSQRSGVATGARRQRPHRVGRHGVLAVGGAVDVDEDPLAAPLAPELDREAVRILRHQRARPRRRAKACTVGEVGRAAQRDGDVQPARAGRHRVGHEADLAQQVAQAPGRGAHLVEAPASDGSRSKIRRSGRSRRSARLVQTCGRDHVLAGQVDERRRVVGEHVVDRAALALGHLGRRDPVGEVARRVLDEEALARRCPGGSCAAPAGGRARAAPSRRPRRRSGGRGRAW